MTYVISDLNGNLAKFRALTEKLPLADDDVLYVLGDSADYGEQTVELLTDMSMRANVYPVAGDHDFTALKMLTGFEKMLKSGATPDPEFAADMMAWAADGGKVTLDGYRALDEEISENPTLPPRLRSLYKPKFLAGETTLTGAERGTALHLVMQDLDFSCEASEQSVREQVEKLRAQRKLTDEQASAVDVRAIVRFLRSDLAARIRKNAQTVRREYRFSLLRPVRDFATLDADDAVLLQGVVDCFFEEDGELVVVDFKTDRIGRTQIEERAEHYRPQLETYSMALMRVMGKKVREKVLYFFSVGEEKVL